MTQRGVRWPGATGILPVAGWVSDGRDARRPSLAYSPWASVDACADARAEDRASSDEGAGQEPRKERGDLAALEAAEFPAHFMPPTVFTDSNVAYTRRLPLANVVVRQL